MKIQNKYRYELTDRLGALDVSPLGESSFTIDYSPEEDGKRFYSREFKGKITFTGAVFDRLRLIERSMYICTEQRLKVFRQCEPEKLIFDGFFKLTEGEWNLDKCYVSLKFEKNTPDRCIELGRNEKIDLFANIGNRVVINTAIQGGGVFEYLEFSQVIPHGTIYDTYGGYVWQGPGTPNSTRFVQYEFRSKSSYDVIMDGAGGTSFDVHYEATSKWVREIIIKPSSYVPPDDWLLLEDLTTTNGTKKYARKPLLYNCKSDAQYQNQWSYYDNSTCNVLGASADSGSVIDNGMRLADVLTVCVSRLCPDLLVVSDFFQINAENVSPINYVTGQESETSEIILFQKSDVKRPTATNNATKAVMQLGKLLEALTTMFNVAYSVENGVFRLEHISWFSKNVGLDLTLPRYEKYVNGKNAYRYDNSEIPAVEKWAFKEQNPNVEAWRGEIRYDNACAVVSGRNNEKTYTVDEITSDLVHVMSNPSPDSNVVEDSGLVIVATKKTGSNYHVITQDDGGAFRLNNVLGWKNLLRNYHFHERFLKTGSLNDESVTFITTRRFKKGEKITIPLCCDDVFNPDDRVITNMGDAFINSATFNLKNETLEIEPLYDVFEDLSSNIKPTISGGIYSTPSVPIDIPISASDPDGIITEIKVLTPPSLGSVVVNGVSSVTFTPAAGQSGHYSFSLVAVDNWSEESDPAVFLIEVAPLNQAPQATDDSFTVFYNQGFSPLTSIFDNDNDNGTFTVITPSVTTAQVVHVTIDSFGYFYYDPPLDFIGQDSFVYTIEDGFGAQSSATVFLNVVREDWPVAVPDSYITPPNTTLSIDGTSAGQKSLIFNDYTPDGLLYTYTTTAETKATAAGGSVSITSGGLFTYTPPVGFLGADSFEYTVNNVNGSATGLVTVNVVPTIFVKLVKKKVIHFYKTQFCGEVTPSPAGTDWSASYWLEFYSDADGTTPVDVTGLGFRVIMREDKVGNVNSSITWETAPLTGSSVLLLENFQYIEENIPCTGPTYYVATDITLEAAPHYSIIY